MVNMKDIAVHYDKISAFAMLVDIAKVAGVESIQAALDEIAAQPARALDGACTCGLFNDFVDDAVSWMVAAKKSHPTLLLPAWVDQWQENRPTKRAADALRCEEEGCNEPAVMFYCEDHAP